MAAKGPGLIKDHRFKASVAGPASTGTVLGYAVSDRPRRAVGAPRDVGEAGAVRGTPVSRRPVLMPGTDASARVMGTGLPGRKKELALPDPGPGEVRVKNQRPNSEADAR